MQGEADAKHEVSAGRYDRSLALFKQRLEDDFTGGNNVPFVFGQVLPHDPPLKRFVARDLIRTHGGREIDKTDGFQLLFDTAVEAVAYAQDYHDARCSAMGDGFNRRDARFNSVDTRFNSVEQKVEQYFKEINDNIADVETKVTT